MSFRSYCACLNTPRLICGTNRLSEEVPVIIVNIDRMVQRISHQDLAHSIYSYSRRNHRQSLAGRSGRELRHISAIICKELDCRVNSVTHNNFLSVVHTDFAAEFVTWYTRNGEPMYQFTSFLIHFYSPSSCRYDHVTTEVTGDAVRFVYCFEHTPELSALRYDLNSFVSFVCHRQVAIRNFRYIRRFVELKLSGSLFAELGQEHPEWIEDLHAVVHGVRHHCIPVTCCDDAAREIEIPVPTAAHAYVKQQFLRSVKKQVIKFSYMRLP